MSDIDKKALKKRLESETPLLKNDGWEDKEIDLLKKHFTNRIYIEIQRHNENNEKNFENHLLNVSKSTQIPLIATQEVFYLDKDMYEAHDALTCIGKKNFVGGCRSTS